MSATPAPTSIEYYRPAILDEILGGGHKIIDASAGTGKTFAIEHIVVDLLRTGAAMLDQILVVTFTEKATAELRSRIRATIEFALSGHSADATHESQRKRLADDERERLKTALFSFHLSPIHTIHSFCRRMLTELAFDSGVRFGFDLTSGRLEFHEAFRAELRERLKSDDRVKRLVGEWLSDEGRTADELEQLLWQAHSQRYLRTAGRELNQQAFTDLANAFDAGALVDAFESAAVTDEARRDAIAATRELELLVNRANGSTENLADGLCGFDFDRICSPKKTGKRAGKRKFPDEMPDRVRAIVNAGNLAQAALAIEQRAVDELLPAIAARMDARKRERGTLDYEDMLAWLADALDGPRGKSLAATLRERYRVALIDEFQDTDELQWKIFRDVFIEGDGGNTVFVIGDPKQAIYGFRGADVHAYLEARAQLAKSGATVVPLRENFRSTAAMIEACNLIFDQSAAAPLFTGEIAYSHPVQCGRPALRAIAANRQSIAPVTLMKFQPRDDRYKSSQPMREAMGRRIAEAIRRIIADPDHAIEICDDGQSPRRAGAKDVYVLTRTNTESAEIAGYLRQAGVPFAFYKQDGLFQTREAAAILDLLRGIDEPGRRSNRLKAWASPFFAVDYGDLARLDNERSSHPMLERLFEWRALAEAGRFADLFDALLHQSGLAERELLLSDGRRALTNYEHIFEILTRDASRHGISLAEIIELLDAYIAQRATPAGSENDPDVQRVEDDRDAVQIMTIHKSKGLEADVVALYGGFFANNRFDPVRIYHEGRKRRLAIGKPAQAIEKAAIAKEQDEEDQRLLYVALTRARAMLILPYVPDGTLNRDLTGSYAQLNNRLRALDREARLQALFTAETVAAPPSIDSPGENNETAIDENALCDWLASTSQSAGFEREFTELSVGHRGLMIESYTSLQAARETGVAGAFDSDEFKTSVDAIEARADSVDLPGGRDVGIFLHEAIEKLDFEAFGDAPDLKSWMARDDIRELFASAMRRHGVNDPRWLVRGREMVFNALTSPVALGETVLERALCRLLAVREMEFAYPIPEKHHSLLGDGPGGAWTVGRGYVKGFIDFVFRRGKLTYFADWKGDLLPSYEPAAVARHVERHYRLQARIYSVGVVRLLDIHTERDYASRFGGLLYVFLRGVSQNGDGTSGFYFARPSWNEVLTYESELLSREPDSERRA